MIGKLDPEESVMKDDFESSRFTEESLIRESLFRYTKEDSYEYPAPRVVEIRGVIQQLDELIEANLSEDHDH